MFLNALKIACNQLVLLAHGGLTIFRSMSFTQENWKHYHLLTHKQSYISLIMSKITMFQSDAFSSVCIDEYILIHIYF